MSEVVVSMNGVKYHKQNCGRKKGGDIHVTEETAEKFGYGPCKTCYGIKEGETIPDILTDIEDITGLEFGSKQSFLKKDIGKLRNWMQDNLEQSDD